MFIAAVIRLRAKKAGKLYSSTGRDVHGFWMRHWEQVSTEFSAQLHKYPAYTLSPLMGLHRRKGRINVQEGANAWLRVTTLQANISEQLMTVWLPALNQREIVISGLPWALEGVVLDGFEWAGTTSCADLVDQFYHTSALPRKWNLFFKTATSFGGRGGDFPVPLPDGLMRSWLRRWENYVACTQPDLPLAAAMIRKGTDAWIQAIRDKIVISRYNLKTELMKERGRSKVGALGRLEMVDKGLPTEMVKLVNLMTAFAFYAGSGQKTTQGMGMTRVLGDGEQQAG